MTEEIKAEGERTVFGNTEGNSSKSNELVTVLKQPYDHLKSLGLKESYFDSISLLVVKKGEKKNIDFLISLKQNPQLVQELVLICNTINDKRLLNEVFFILSQILKLSSVNTNYSQFKLIDYLNTLIIIANNANPHSAINLIRSINGVLSIPVIKSNFNVGILRQIGEELVNVSNILGKEYDDFFRSGIKSVLLKDQLFDYLSFSIILKIIRLGIRDKNEFLYEINGELRSSSLPLVSFRLYYILEALINTGKLTSEILERVIDRIHLLENKLYYITNFWLFNIFEDNYLKSNLSLELIDTIFDQLCLIDVEGRNSKYFEMNKPKIIIDKSGKLQIEIILK